MRRFLWLPLLLVADAGWAGKGDRTLIASMVYSDFKKASDGFRVTGASDKPLYGINLKHYYEAGDRLGVMFSVLYSKNGTSKRAESGSQFSFNTQYLSLSAGPAWRINPYVSVYGLVGASSLRSDLEYRTPSQRKVRKKSKRRLRAKPRSRGSIHHVHEFSSDYGLVGGVGVQFNLSKNLVLDTSWEYSWLRNNRISSWGMGLGYRF